MDLAIEKLWKLHAPPKLAGLLSCSMHIPAGRFLTIAGPSGSGKSTLLRLIAGLEKANRGRIFLSGRDITDLPPSQRNIGLLPQRPALYPHLSVRRNLSIGLEMQNSRQRPKVPPAEIHRRVDEAIGLLGLEELLDERPNHLSGGEQQRVGLGRLLVRRPDIWLLDEPFAHVDFPRRMQLKRELHLLWKRFLTTIITVTHDPVEALSLGERLAVLIRSRVRQMGEPLAVLKHPEHRLVAEFLGWPPMNLTDGVLTRSSEPGEGFRFAAADGAFQLPVPAELVTRAGEGQPVTAGIRPEDLQPIPVAAPNPSPNADCRFLPDWVVRLAEPAPPAWLVTVERGNRLWALWWHDSAPP
ncbi:MAG TPA: ABC transporter ATP-binding protein, partial [Gemmataceae bacterium]|nr:ABC transporter ATP-binding protein [Gemmataceae bacterium]